MTPIPLTDKPRLVIQTEHVGRINGAVLDPAGTRIVSGGRDRTVKLWDAATGRLVRTFAGSDSGVTGVAFSPDGRRVVAAGRRRALVWDAVDGRLVATLHKGKRYVDRVEFGNHGRRLATAGRDGFVQLFDAATGTFVREVKHGHGGVTALAFDPGGERLASAGGTENRVRIWALADGRLERSLMGHDAEVRDVAFDPSGKQLASAGHDVAIRLWDVATGRQVGVLRPPAPDRVRVRFSVHGRIDPKRYARMLKRKEKRARGDRFGVFAVAFHPGGGQLASAGGDHVVRIWGMRSMKIVASMDKGKEAIVQLSYSPDGRRLLAAAHDAITLWDIGAATALQHIEVRRFSDGIDAMSPSGRVFARGDSSSAELWRPLTGTPPCCARIGQTPQCIDQGLGRSRLVRPGGDRARSSR